MKNGWDRCTCYLMIVLGSWPDNLIKSNIVLNFLKTPPPILKARPSQIIYKTKNSVLNREKVVRILIKGLDSNCDDCTLMRSML